MADQTYNLTQTGAEVQAIINDANGVKGAGATTSLTTDYIMLKDTSGNYHKIQKSSFTEAVRNTLASLLVNNDKGTTISQIAAIASGDFGSVTPANLASVLGASVLGGMKEITQNADLNSLEFARGCSYICQTAQVAGSLSNTPISNAAFFLFSFSPFMPNNSSYTIQIAFNYLGIYFRGLDSYNGSIWTAWKAFTLT